MGRFCVIGLGNFGYHVARTLYAEKQEVIAVDLSQEAVQKVHDDCTYAVLGDAANKEFLIAQGIDEMDAVIISTGEKTHLATLITLFLKELKVRRIIVKASSEDHGRILAKVGATEIIYPEKDMALKTARSLTKPNILDFISLSEDFSIAELAPPHYFIGKSLVELNLRKKFNVTVIAVKDVLTGAILAPPPADHVIKDSEILVFIGKSGDIDKAYGRG
ncbi:MAG: TrkA family potassium uptake protein [Deltaproteobacteria bacterium]|nr:TrkA family potassium uptake protein [Deltaproteobacteria bacterium]